MQHTGIRTLTLSPGWEMIHPSTIGVRWAESPYFDTAVRFTSTFGHSPRNKQHHLRGSLPD